MKVVSDATRAHSRTDKAPTTEVLIPPEVQDTLESSRENPYSIGQRPFEREAYVTVDCSRIS